MTIKTALSRSIRRTQLGLAHAGMTAVESLRRKARQLEIRLDGLHEGLDIKAIAKIRSPEVDLHQSDDPIATIMSSPEFRDTTAFFENNSAAARSLVSPQAQALLFAVVRNQRPDHVFEIGTFKAGTTEAICRALHANGHGILHTVDPFRPEYILAILKHWPPQLLKYVQTYPTNSMAFYIEMERRGIHPDLVFVDGNHDYEFALFDIGRGARYLRRGGFIFVDNIAQPGPFLAARDFLTANAGWREHGLSVQRHNASKSYDRARTSIVDTDFMVLRAPETYIVDAQASNIGGVRWPSNNVNGVRLKLARTSGAGTLNVEVVLRGFGAVLAEALGQASMQLSGASGEISVAFAPTPTLIGQFDYFTVEPWLIWQGDAPLHLLEPPTPI